jgi:hypothetical protein
MNKQSLNRAIGLAMSALQQARAFGYSQRAVAFISCALSMLNRARASLKVGDAARAQLLASIAHQQITCAIAAR